MNVSSEIAEGLLDEPDYLSIFNGIARRRKQDVTQGKEIETKLHEAMAYA